jgi:hypothetical protein
MPIPFAVLEDRVNSVAVAQLANATATIAGQNYDGIFTRAFVEDGGVESVKPVFIRRTADLPAMTHGQSVVINNVTYSVVGIQPDNGITTLILERP